MKKKKGRGCDVMWRKGDTGVVQSDLCQVNSWEMQQTLLIVSVPSLVVHQMQELLLVCIHTIECGILSNTVCVCLCVYPSTCQSDALQSPFHTSLVVRVRPGLIQPISSEWESGEGTCCVSCCHVSKCQRATINGCDTQKVRWGIRWRTTSLLYDIIASTDISATQLFGHR